ncbi:MAG: helix-turn-helix domain-containing protein, partial [Flavisolibacter sp.]|nr:helix-turn-helix domain-containing protein [Flavisolibacter sp.]
MTIENTQVQFFQHIKNLLPAHLSLVDEVAEVLNISTESAYRRIRGEKPIDFEELKKLASKYKISIDQFLLSDSSSVLFSDRSLQANLSLDFSIFLKSLVQDLTFINSFEKKKITYLSKDIPFYYNFTFPELGAFKCFFWLKSVNPAPAYTKEIFSIYKYKEQFSELTSKIYQLQLQVPTIEIWNVECVNVTIRQVEYLRETKSFASEKDAF